MLCLVRERPWRPSPCARWRPEGCGVRLRCRAPSAARDSTDRPLPMMTSRSERRRGGISSAWRRRPSSSSSSSGSSLLCGGALHPRLAAARRRGGWVPSAQPRYHWKVRTVGIGPPESDESEEESPLTPEEGEQGGPWSPVLHLVQMDYDMRQPPPRRRRDLVRKRRCDAGGDTPSSRREEGGEHCSWQEIRIPHPHPA